MKDLIDRNKFPVLSKGRFAIRRRRFRSADLKYLPTENRPSNDKLEEALRLEESEASAAADPHPSSFPLRGSVPGYEDPTGPVNKGTMNAEACLELLESWSKDESGYDEKNWDEIKEGLESNRLSSRRRFRE